MRFFPQFPHFIWPAVVGVALLASDGSAQRIQSTLDVGGVGIQYADTLSGFAATLTPSLLADWGNRVGSLSGTYSQFGSDWSLQGQASGSVFAPLKSFIGELTGFAGGSTHRDGSRTSELLLNARLHAQHRLAEWFVGLGAGSTSFADETRTILLAEAGASRAISQGDATFTVTPVAMGDSIRYADGQFALTLQQASVDFAAIVGARFGDQLTSLGGTTRVWGNVSATKWVTSRAAVVLSGGTYPIDPTQGFPGGRFISFAIRLAHPRRTQPSQLRDSVEMEATAVTFNVEKSGDLVTFKVLSPLARNVELAADFTGWEPVQMAPAGAGWWVVSRPLKPGKYQINLRMNGGRWVVPPGLLGMLDEFGGSVGLLVVD